MLRHDHLSEKTECLFSVNPFLIKIEKIGFKNTLHI